MEMMDKNFVPEESGHFTVDEKSRQVELTEVGHEFVEDLLIKQKLLAEVSLCMRRQSFSAAPCSCGFKSPPSVQSGYRIHSSEQKNSTH